MLPPVLVPRHSEWPPMHPRLPPPYHSAPQESPMPLNASFPANFRQTPGDDIPTPFRQGENYNPYEMPGNVLYCFSCRDFVYNIEYFTDYLFHKFLYIIRF